MLVIGYFPFNRTSMESKLFSDTHGVEHASLLIEPVWNRNAENGSSVTLSRTLLIEPVWNRNVSSLKIRMAGGFLLIEPVWNRNVVSSVYGFTITRF